MRCHLIRRLLSGVAFGVLGLFGQAQAAILDFESLTPTIYFNDDTFQQFLYTFKQQGDFGVVGADFLIAQAPIGNTTQFYSGLNDASLALTRTDGVGFNLYSFDAGFVTPAPQSEGVFPGRIVVFGLTTTGSVLFNSWEFAPSDADGNFSFRHYTTGLSAFRDLAAVSFLGCKYGEDGVSCANPAENLAQFSLDNVNVIAVPEPSTYALLVLGLAGVAAYSRRRARS